MEDKIVGNRYKLVKKIGSGGMADVYLAVDEVLRRDVAVKILHKQFANDPEFVERFRREAQSAANLNHPNIVSIYDRGEFDGTFYIAMELLQGENLKDLILKEAPMPADKIADIAIQICSALQFAHKNGVIHRDVKPQNIIVTDDDHIKVTDFGIARAASDSQVTRTGTILGTAHYLSPEQAQGHQVVEQSDIYSLGIVLYEMATGLLPFKGENPIAVALKHVNEEPISPRRVIGTVPEGLESIILKALSKDHQQRYSSASDMKDDLDRFRNGLSPTALSEAETGLLATRVIGRDQAKGLTAMPGGIGKREKGKGKKKKWLWLLPLLILLLGIAAAAFAYYELSQKPTTSMVPSVVGRSFDAAQIVLKAAGFKPKTRGKLFSEEYPPEYVVKQDPIGGENVKNGSVVYLWLSKGKQEVTVPDLVGLSQKDAKARIEKIGLKLGQISEEFSDKYGSGEVAKQWPEANVLVNRGTSVNLVISGGSEKISVPSVVGLTAEKAALSLSAAGLQVRTSYDYSSKFNSGTVMGQDPTGGTRLARGSEVTIIVSKGSQKVAVPGIIGFTESASISQISSVGLKASVNYSESGSAPEGTVISQYPSGGTMAMPGSVVKITVAQAPPPVHPGTTTSP